MQNKTIAIIILCFAVLFLFIVVISNAISFFIICLELHGKPIYSSILLDYCKTLAS